MSNPTPTTPRAQSLAEAIAAVRASRISDADKDELCELFILLEIPAERMTCDQLRRAREAAGLSLGQAARLLQVRPGMLAEIEEGIPAGEGLGCWPRGLCERMNDVYRLGGPMDIHVIPAVGSELSDAELDAEIGRLDASIARYEEADDEEVDSDEYAHLVTRRCKLGEERDGRVSRAPDGPAEDRA